jgi:hypothetical protein
VALAQETAMPRIARPTRRPVPRRPPQDVPAEPAGRGRGRPPRPVTVSLPEDLLARLRDQHVDLGRAIVSLFDQAPGAGGAAPVQLVEFGRGALILVPPASALQRVPGIELIPLSGGRALIALDQPMSPSDLELALGDALAGGEVPPADRGVLADVVDVLREARCSATATLRQRTIVIVERTPRRRSPRRS